VAVDGDERAPGLAFASQVEVHDFSDVEGVVAIGRRHAVDGVLTVASDRAVPVVAAVAERLGLPGIGTAVAARMTHKAAMRGRLAAAGVPQPLFARVTSDESARAALERLGRVRSIEGLDQVRAAPGVVQAELYFGLGEVIRPVQVDADRLGYVLAAGKSREDALELANAAASRLRVRADHDAAAA